MLFRRAHDPDADDATEALVDGDRTYSRERRARRCATATSASCWGGTFLSNIGTWMQNVLLGAFALKIGDAGYVGLLYFAQLGPLLFLSQIGGVIADQVNRRRFLVSMQTLQMAAVVRARGARDRRPPLQDGDLPLRARDRHRQRAQRAGDGGDPADAGAP